MRVKAIYLHPSVNVYVLFLHVVVLHTQSRIGYFRLLFTVLVYSYQSRKHVDGCNVLLSG